MIEVFDMEQGGEEWHRARMGIPTASMFATVMARGRGGGLSLTRAKYLRQLAAEIITDDPMPEGYISADMERGRIMENEARNYFTLIRQEQPQRVGFIRNGSKGASPDSLLGTNSGLEIKSAAPHVQIERLEQGRLPLEYVCQVQGSMWVAEREHWEFISYCPKLPPLIVTVDRDEKKIAEIAEAVDRFNEELAMMVEWLKKLS
jgi:hypothetical protein